LSELHFHLTDALVDFSRLMKLQRKIAHASDALKIFIFSEWNFGVDNFQSLNKVLSSSDEYEELLCSKCAISSNYRNWLIERIST
jgi:hypothetical protein